LPSRIDPIDDNREREVPSNAWDAFDINQRDQASVDEMNIATLKDIALRPIGRLAQLAIWLTKVLDQPPALCWAARQLSLNRFVISIISDKLLNYSQPIHPLIRRRWKILIDVWKNRSYFTSDQLFFLKKDRNWNATVVEQFEKLTQPYLSVRPFRYRQTIPQKLKINRENINQFAPVTITYPHFDQPLDIPDEWCYTALKTLRRNLEFAILCEKEIGKYKRLSFQPIIYDKDHNGIEGIHHPYGIAIYTSDLSYMVIYFARLFDQLCKVDPSAAKFEFLSWPQDDEMAFAHLRIWAAGKNEIVANDEFGQFILSLPDEIFWNPQHQLDLLMVLKKRWDNLNSSTRAMIEKRLLKNSSRLSNEDQYTRKKRHAWLSLNSLWWLKFNGCELSSATQKKAQKLRSVEPEWTEKQARNAARRLTSGFIKSNTDYTALLNIPLSELLPEAEKIQQGRNAISVVNKPFEGLARDKPVLAFSALCFEAKKGIFRAWAWQTLLRSEALKADRNRFKLLIAKRLLNYPDRQIATIIRSISCWLYDNADKLEKICLPVFFRLAKKLVEILRIQPDNDQSNIEQSINKLSDAINTPAGMVTLALLEKPFKQNLGDKSFYKEWLALIESLLKLPDISRQYVLVILFSKIDWFFPINKDWTQKHLLPIFHSRKSIDRDAAWSGFFQTNDLPRPEIFSVIKDDLFTINKTRPYFYLKYIDRYAGLILALWSKTDNATGVRCITDEELRGLLLKSDDNLRTKILKQIEIWISGLTTYNSSDEWKSRLPEFFSTWPKQIDAWSPKVSTGFFNLLIWSGEQFPFLLKSMIHHLNKIYDIGQLKLDDMITPDFGNRIIPDYPKELLELLFTVLPNDTRQRPFKIAEILQKIVEADSSLKKDERYVELKRRYSI